MSTDELACFSTPMRTLKCNSKLLEQLGQILGAPDVESIFECLKRARCIDLRSKMSLPLKDAHCAAHT